MSHATSSHVTYEAIIDLRPHLARIKAELRDELLAELRSSTDQGWPAYLSVETCASYLDVSVERLRKLIARREIPFLQEAAGCRISFAREELDRWMTSKQIAAKASGPTT